ncbi:MAG: hypothetical protein L0I76_36600, partial [Pseudonocardia sp.]|nr:hypothetical protein [Pseudonocardia sp.]
MIRRVVPVRWLRCAVLVLGSVAVLLLGLLAAPAAGTPAEPPPAAAAPTSWTFACTGAAETFQVPAGVTHLGVDMHGGHGGSRIPAHGGPGGNAGRAVGTISVTPGTTLSIAVGCAGGAPGPAGP